MIPIYSKGWDVIQKQVQRFKKSGKARREFKDFVLNIFNFKQKRQFRALGIWCDEHIFESVYLRMKWSEVKSLNRVRLFVTLGTVAYQAPPSMGFSRQEYWSGLPFPSPGDLPDPGIEPGFPALETDASTSEPPGKPLPKNSDILKRLTGLRG